MKVVGMITEYNPFHIGHAYHLEQSKLITGAEVSVAIMSGNFVQRGEPAFLNKWDRARIAVECGVDLVLELPFAYACNNAEYFAKGAVKILNGLGCVDFLSFGSENGKINDIKMLAEFFINEPKEFKIKLQEKMQKGNSYPKSVYLAVLDIFGEEKAKILLMPNNILAIEYVKQLIISSSLITPVTVKRIGAGYKDNIIKKGFQSKIKESEIKEKQENKILSASGIRKNWDNEMFINEIKDSLPRGAINIINAIKNDINNHINPNINVIFPLLVLEICKSKEVELARILTMSEGFENKLKKEIRNVNNIEEFIEKINSRRYTSSKIKRLFLQIIMNLRKEEFEHILQQNLGYARILAANNIGTKLIKEIKNRELNSIPIITNINKQVEVIKQKELIDFDILASDIYNLITKQDLYTNSDYVKVPYIKQ